MAEYYAVERSPEYLAHYGVRGMKWGVRKAIERGDSARLSRHYNKAAKKLAKLSLNANRSIQEQRFKQAKRNMAFGAASSAGISAGLTAAANGRMSIASRAKYAGIAGLAGGIGGALLNSRGILAGRHISDRGHAKAIAKREQWRKDMEETFKGTKYGGKAQKKFHKEITRLSNVDNPKSYIANQHRKASNELNRAYVVDLRSKKKRAEAGASGSRVRQGNISTERRLSSADRDALLAIANGQAKPYKRRRS